jgi:hypothetical protein
VNITHGDGIRTYISNWRDGDGDGDGDSK